jgi:hypothetical protein
MLDSFHTYLNGYAACILDKSPRGQVNHPMHVEQLVLDEGHTILRPPIDLIRLAAAPSRTFDAGHPKPVPALKVHDLDLVDNGIMDLRELGQGVMSSNQGR